MSLFWWLMCSKLGKNLNALGSHKKQKTRPSVFNQNSNLSRHTFRLFQSSPLNSWSCVKMKHWNSIVSSTTRDVRQRQYSRYWLGRRRGDQKEWRRASRAGTSPGDSWVRWDAARTSPVRSCSRMSCGSWVLCLELSQRKHLSASVPQSGVAFWHFMSVARNSTQFPGSSFGVLGHCVAFRQERKQCCFFFHCTSWEFNEQGGQPMTFLLFWNELPLRKLPETCLSSVNCPRK